MGVPEPPGNPGEDYPEDEKDCVIVLDRGTCEDGRPYWLYIAVKHDKYREYMQAKGMVTFTDYGKILRYGYAKEVPQSVKEEMKQRYGCDENYMQKLRADASGVTAFLKTFKESNLGDIVSMLKEKE